MRRSVLTVCFLTLAGSMCLAQAQVKADTRASAPPNPPAAIITPQQVAAWVEKHPVAAADFMQHHPEIGGYVANHPVTVDQAATFANQHPVAATEFIKNHPDIGSAVASEVFRHGSANNPSGNSGNGSSGASSNPPTVIYYPDPYSYPYPYPSPYPCPYPNDPPAPRRRPHPKQTPSESPVFSTVFNEWLRVEVLGNAWIQLTYLGDEHPVRVAQFFTEDASGRRLNMETVVKAPYMAQLRVDNVPAAIGVIVKYRDGYETTIRFPYPLPAALINNATVGPRVESLNNGKIRLTYLGDEYPVKAVQFYTEDGAGRRLDLETVGKPPFTTQLPVDNGVATIGMIVIYKDRHETFTRFPYPAPAALTRSNTVAPAFTDAKRESELGETDRRTYRGNQFGSCF